MDSSAAAFTTGPPQQLSHHSQHQHHHQQHQRRQHPAASAAAAAGPAPHRPAQPRGQPPLQQPPPRHLRVLQQQHQPALAQAIPTEYAAPDAAVFHHHLVQQTAPPAFGTQQHAQLSPPLPLHAPAAVGPQQPRQRAASIRRTGTVIAVGDAGPSPQHRSSAPPQQQQLQQPPQPLRAPHPAPGSGPLPGTPHQSPHGQFGVLTPASMPAQHQQQRDEDGEDDDEDASGYIGGEPESGAAAESRPHGHLSTRIVLDPPDLQMWRERLFNVDDLIILTDEEFETYFPHIDNVYSHRSTQKYKRKPFVSHYWDCRMKGRPPGTPKSDDPNKKKRKRSARERDLCDVKIKITEYFPGASLGMLDLPPSGDGVTSLPPTAFSGAGVSSQRFWTVQRVNGNGANGKGDGIAGPHKHTLEKSDEIKKNSVQRWLAGQVKEARKTQKGQQPHQQQQQPHQQQRHRRPTGAAAATAKRHARESDLKLYAACFCPFSQRVWVALEAKGLPYQYLETDPFAKPRQLLEANPRGLVPAIRSGDWACGESTVILEYLEDLDSQVCLYPTEPRLRANCRLWVDHVNTRVVPGFYALLRAAEPGRAREEAVERLQHAVGELVQAADERGPYFLGPSLCLVDVHFAPFALRLSRVLGPLREWTGAAPGTRWEAWVQALERNPHVRATTSEGGVYLETADLLLAGEPAGLR